MKDPKKVKRGKKSKKDGAAFELRVRKDLESQGWIVDKWSNNVEFKFEELKPGKIKLPYFPKIIGKLIPAKRKYNPFNKALTIGTGFPDFIAFNFDKLGDLTNSKLGYTSEGAYEIIGVESKTNGYLDKAEKEKCDWLLKNNIFSKILIAKKIKENNRIKIEYKEYNNVNIVEKR